MIKNIFTFGIVYLIAFSAFSQELKHTIFPACFNTKYDDFGVRKVGDQLFVISASRELDTTIRFDELANKPYTDIYEVLSCQLVDAKLFSKENQSQNLISSLYYDGPIAPDLSGTSIFFSNNSSEANGTMMGVFYLVMTENGWSEPMPFTLNSDQYSVMHPFFDAVTKRFYFSSDMPGGLGGFDIYSMNFDGKSFTDLKNERTINSEANEHFPCINGNIMYVTSNRVGGIGGMDIYAYAENVLSLLAAPINTVYDDLDMHFIDDVSGFFSSNRNDAGATDDSFFFIQSHDQLIDASIVDLAASFSKEKVNGLTELITKIEGMSGATMMLDLSVKTLKNLSIESVSIAKDVNQSNSDLKTLVSQFNETIQSQVLANKNVNYTSASKLIDQVSELSDLLLNEFDSKKQDSLFQSLTKLLSDYQPDLETNNQVVLNQLADKLTARNQLAARQEIVLEQLTQASKVTYFELLKVPSTPENDLIKAEMARVLFDNIKRDQEFEMQRQLLAIEQQNTALFNQLNQTLATAFANDSSMNPLTAKILLADITALTDAIQQEKDPIKRAQLIQELKQKIASLSPTQQALVKDILTSIEANNEIVNELVAANAKNKLLYSDAAKKAFIELSLNKDNLSTEELMARFKQFENQFNIPLASLFDVNGNKLDPQTLAEFLNAHIPDPILFDFDSAVLKSVYYSQLNDIADFLKNYPQFQVYVDGYTDITGSVSYNVKLSSKRAKSAKTYLKTLGVKESDFVLTYHGPKHPVASNKTKEGRKLNRRVEIRLVERK
jgi:outer membrane protein OmpA-like peptidoglycan-associated protein